jgi:hypothetical protein
MGVAARRCGSVMATCRSARVTRLREHTERPTRTQTVRTPTYRSRPQFCQGWRHIVWNAQCSGRIYITDLRRRFEIARAVRPLLGIQRAKLNWSFSEHQTRISHGAHYPIDLIDGE